MNLQVQEGAFFCSVCKSNLTIYSENKGKGIRARCKVCHVTYYYPACEDCGQATWRHDDTEHEAIVAKKTGKGFCRKCLKTKELTEFNKRDGKLNSRCKDCQAQYYKEWYNKTKDSGDDTTYVDSSILDELFGEY